MAFAANPWISPEEYLALERKAEFKSEYVNGRVFAMAGASLEHAEIACNILGELRSRLRDTPCRPVGSDVRVKVNETGLYTYPDVVVVCGEPRLDHGDTLTNPTAIFEVLSPSTEAYDRGAKFEHYEKLETLRDYVLVAQDRMRVEHFRREGNLWVREVSEGPDGVLRLPSVGCELPLAEVYLRVELPAEDAGDDRRPKAG